MNRLSNIPLSIDTDRLLTRLRIKDRPDYRDDFIALVEEALKIGKPDVIFDERKIEKLSDDEISIGGTIFKSRVLRVNLENVETVYPAISTCGQTLEAWSQSLESVIEKFWAESIKKEALSNAIEALNKALIEKSGTENISLMAPGSLEDWPITEQKNLFTLFNGENEALGVTLNQSCVVNPLNTVSCLGFVSEEGFESCQLCDKPKCPDRRAAYDQRLFDHRYRVT